MRLVVAGTPSVALPSLATLVASKHEVVAVLTRPDAARGRRRTPVPSEVGAWALERGIPVLRPQHPRDPEFVAALAALAPDACPVVAYGALLPASVLQIPTFGWINLHFSLLPRWRGAAPVQRAIMAGDEVTGATTFRIVGALDAGPVYDTVTRPLDGTEIAGDLLEELAVSGADLLLRTIDRLPTTDPTPQPGGPAALAPRLTVAEARLDWTRPAEDLDRLIRGCAPAPGAWTQVAGTRFRVLYARPVAGEDLPPGQLRIEKKRVLVGTGTAALELVRLQPQGRPAMAGADWGRGLREAPVAFDSADQGI
ncbi:MAG: methionyl-tRNA formyltransferase [Propioniciclava sp.]